MQTHKYLFVDLNKSLNYITSNNFLLVYTAEYTWEC